MPLAQVVEAEAALPLQQALLVAEAVAVDQVGSSG
jgi:hypothetical protein